MVPLKSMYMESEIWNKNTPASLGLFDGQSQSHEFVKAI